MKTDRLGFLHASPLVLDDNKTPIDKLNVDLELSRLKDSIFESNKAICFRSEVATRMNLRNLVRSHICT